MPGSERPKASFFRLTLGTTHLPREPLKDESWRARVVQLIDPMRDLDGATRTAVEVERVTTNARRAGLLSRVMLVFHCGFSVWLTASGPTTPETALPFRNLAMIHAAYAVLNVVFLATRWRLRPLRMAQGDVFGVAYLAYGVAVTLNGQLFGRGSDVFLIVVVLVSLTLLSRTAFASMAIATAVVVLGIGIAVLQPDPTTRFSLVANVLPVSVVAWVVGRAQYRAFVHEVVLRRTVVAQRDELDATNRELAEQKEHLESRVQTQVETLIERMAQVEGLDKQLRERVRDRSRELARAVATLGRAWQELDAGTIVSDRWVIERPLGAGGMGVVYQALDRKTNQRVALKMLRIAPDVPSVRRFLSEAEIAAELSHPGIARTFHIDVSEDGRPFQVQELVQGVALDVEIKRRRRLPTVQCARIGENLAAALACAHATAVVHRDVKPSNLMLTTAAPGLKLLDFGVSKLRDVIESSDHTSTMVGTPAFMAPEQVSAPGDVGPAADVYAVGVTLFLLVCGRLPFAVGSASLFRSHVASDLEDGASLSVERLTSLVMACLAKDPVDRPRAGDLERALTLWCESVKVPALHELNQMRRAEADALTLEEESGVSEEIA